MIKLLGESNVKRLEDGITDTILGQIQNDFDNNSEYILSPEDVLEFLEECKEKAFSNIKEEVIKDMEDKIRVVYRQ